MSNSKPAKPSGFRLKLLWDIFMILAVIVNLHLIVFDLTYLIFRPEYYKHLPQVVEIYDPILGIEPHRLTYDVLTSVTELRTNWDSFDENQKKASIEKTKGLFSRMLNENPFERTGQTANLQRIKQLFRERYLFETKDQNKIGASAVFDWFWNTLDNSNIKSRMDFFDQELVYLIGTNYYRNYSLSGAYVDKFFMLDAPFYILFLIEFLIQWYLSIRNKTYIAWFLYPFYHWYDALGLVPFAAEFRFFRLFRIYSIIMKLKQNILTAKLTDNFITKAIGFYGNIIKEELSDLVTIRILSEVQEEVKSGNSLTMFTSVLETRKSEIKKIVLQNLRSALTDKKSQDEIKKLLSEALARSSHKAISLKVVPGIIKEELTKDIGLAVFDAFNEILLQKVSGSEGEKNISALVDSIVEEVIKGAKDSEMNQFSSELTIEVIENMKKSVALKKWAGQKN